MSDDVVRREIGASEIDAPEIDIEEVVLRYHRGVYGYAYRLCGSHEDAEDLTQQVFVVAHRKLDQLRDAERIQAWLFTITRNLFLKMLRRRDPQLWESERLDEEVSRPSPWETRLEGESLQYALARLPETQRLILVMFYYEELSYKEIAEQLGIAIGTVMSRLSRAKQALRAEIEALDGESAPLKGPMSGRGRRSACDE